MTDVHTWALCAHVWSFVFSNWSAGSGGLAPQEVRRAAEIFGILDPANARFYSKT